MLTKLKKTPKKWTTIVTWLCIIRSVILTVLPMFMKHIDYHRKTFSHNVSIDITTRRWFWCWEVLQQIPLGGTKHPTPNCKILFSRSHSSLLINQMRPLVLLLRALKHKTPSQGPFIQKWIFCHLLILQTRVTWFFPCEYKEQWLKFSSFKKDTEIP